MPQNRYDDPAFFDKYAQMDRSQKGLAGGVARAETAAAPLGGQAGAGFGLRLRLALRLCR